MTAPTRPSTRRDRTRYAPVSAAIAIVFLLIGGVPLPACHDGSPLILDLDDNGVLTTSLFYPVMFDLDGDGAAEKIAWTFPDSEEAFLWLDLNGNRQVDDGRELFGSATILPTGQPTSHGFEALAAYDELQLGGNEDGIISNLDLVWHSLRLWVDSSHDGVSQREEILRLPQAGVVALGLSYVESDEVDGSMNRHRYQGAFVKSMRLMGEDRLRTLPLHDVFFRIAHEEDH